MHALAVQLPVFLAAEKSRTAFYIVGGVLVVWALVLSLVLGLRRVDFPRTPALERLVIGVSAGLVAATAATAVATAGTPAKTATAPAAAPAPSTSSSLSLEANPHGEPRYNTKELVATAGTVTITLTNKSPVEHNVTIAKSGLPITAAGAVLGATPTFKGGSRAVTLRLQPGTYIYFSSVPGQRGGGMEGTLKIS
jgi:plastocyanin